MEDTTCINESPDCEGAVQLRMALSGTGIPYPRCERHWQQRLDLEDGLNARYPVRPPADWDPLDAGEQWDDD